MSLTFNNRTAVVTGAGRGIGRAIAAELARNGVHVICVSRSEESCKGAADEINAAGGKASHAAVDIGDSKAVTACSEALLKEHGTIDILVNNAGITRDTLLLRMSDEEWDDVIRTNLSGAFYFVRGLLRPMTRARWGRIVNISSVVGLTGNPGQANYAAAKAGLIGFTKALARELASRSITVNALAPGFVTTDMTAKLDETQLDMARKTIPLKRLGTVDDIAPLAAYLCAEESSYVTGQVFTVDGGMVM